MRMSYEKGSLLSMLVSAALLLSGCSVKGEDLSQDLGNHRETITRLRVYADYADEDTKVPYDYAVQALKKEMPNVELELEAMSRDDGTKLKTYAAAGFLPDIFYTNVDEITAFRKSNNILILDDYAKDFKSKLLPGNEKQLYHSDGHIYNFPFAGTEYVLLYYNKEIFQQNGVKVPETYEELLAAVKTFKAKGIIPLSIFAQEKWPCVALYDILATRFVPQGILNFDQNKAKASDAGYQTAAGMLEELVKAGLVPEGATNLNYAAAAALFYQGRAAMFINGQWEIEASTKELGDKVDWMLYPAKDAASVEASRYNWCGGGSLSGFSVSANTKDKALAAKVAEFLALKYAECKYSQRANPLVATRVDAPIQRQYPPMMQKLLKELSNIKSTTAFDWNLTNSKLKVGLEECSQRLLTGTYSSEKFVQDMDKVIEDANK